MIAVLLVAQIVSSSPPLAPAEAAQVLARLDSPANRTHVVACGDCDGPRVVVIPSSPTSGPFGAFPTFPPSRPLSCCSLYVNGWPVFRAPRFRFVIVDGSAGASFIRPQLPPNWWGHRRPPS